VDRRTHEAGVAAGYEHGFAGKGLAGFGGRVARAAEQVAGRDLARGAVELDHCVLSVVLLE
jgi:hypothetical protein